MLWAVAIGVLAVLAVAGALAVRRRRARRSALAPSLSLGAHLRPAGARHLATRVSELSDLGLHLHQGGTPRRRLGALLGSSSGASR